MPYLLSAWPLMLVGFYRMVCYLPNALCLRWRVTQRGLTTGRNEHIQFEEPQEASVAYGCDKRRSFA
jgi:hypothetical protein